MQACRLRRKNAQTGRHKADSSLTASVSMSDTHGRSHAEYVCQIWWGRAVRTISLLPADQFRRPRERETRTSRRVGAPRARARARPRACARRCSTPLTDIPVSELECRFNYARQTPLRRRRPCNCSCPRGFCSRTRGRGPCPVATIRTKQKRVAKCRPQSPLSLQRHTSR